MATGKLKTVFVCTACGEVSARWQGRCTSCGEWNTLQEDVIRDKVKKAAAGSSNAGNGTLASKIVPLHTIDTDNEENRLHTGISELDRVLGGGIIPGALMLLGGEPGSGKSTLLLQICGNLAKDKNVLYVSGEESARQIKLRASRIGVGGENLFVAPATDIEEICNRIIESKPALVVIDSIQTMQYLQVTSSPGSVSQVKECTNLLLNVAKNYEIPIFIVGHVNKDGAIAGPKVMEHIVDTVLYFEGDKTLPYRMLRSAKNRFGSTNEIGIFDMTQAGLQEVLNPSVLLLEGRPVGVSGNCVACTMEGSRPILSEVQALVTKTAFGTARRTAAGIDYSRMNLLLAVIEKRAGYTLGGYDVYINIIGGLELNEPASDLAVVLAIVSNFLDKPVGDDVLAIGEVGLGGEIRSVSNIENRVKEAARLGFKTAIIPSHSAKLINIEGLPMEILGVSNIKQAIALL
ncbi:DNA repair protein RadA [Ruminococcaceae bacterium OttesenSCG-928-N02]|nr:DNA repair protein RadA [Ruminococcaceae bacterium OttesenSCG-928-N02]